MRSEKITSKKFINLQAQWKKSGFLSGKINDKLWRRFRSSCDYFFESKKSFQKEIDKKRIKDKIQQEKEFQLQQELKKEQQELKNKSSQAPASMSLPKLDNTMMARMTAGSAANIDPTTNLTTTETALLSPLEQAYYTNKRRV